MSLLRYLIVNPLWLMGSNASILKKKKIRIINKYKNHLIIE